MILTISKPIRSTQVGDVPMIVRRHSPCTEYQFIFCLNARKLDRFVTRLESPVNAMSIQSSYGSMVTGWETLLELVWRGGLSRVLLSHCVNGVQGIVYIAVTCFHATIDEAVRCPVFNAMRKITFINVILDSFFSQMLVWAQCSRQIVIMVLSFGSEFPQKNLIRSCLL